jgi:hypothetical protein
MYTVQALWTKAREGLDVTTVLFSNRVYQILKGELANVGAGNPGRKALDMLDLGHPDIDWVGLAKSLGVPSARVTDMEGFNRRFAEGLATSGPYLVRSRAVVHCGPTRRGGSTCAGAASPTVSRFPYGERVCAGKPRLGEGRLWGMGRHRGGRTRVTAMDRTCPLRQGREGRQTARSARPARSPRQSAFFWTAGIQPPGGATGRHADISGLAGGLPSRHPAPGRPALKGSSGSDPVVYVDLRDKLTTPGGSQSLGERVPQTGKANSRSNPIRAGGRATPAGG